MSLEQNDHRLERVCTVAGAEPVRLENLPWPEISALRDRNGGVLLLPLGATEQHGPHLPINTDTLIAESVCWYASAKTNVPVLPILPYTVSAGHTAKNDSPPLGSDHWAELPQSIFFQNLC